ncbi:LuxR C-terminal-related transcriptional regulator [Solirubrobacter ginsenosidimutans]|uniref:LuxR C-terminal-related transcriptional regulator n=1 Tax=Solirubrobacter ginsenosidimutans TaxID=490573 RepID=A0A9X3S4D9_9ACTN|nr:LuxR family transcriptional regulator [Solirubrobacter ginsenosidimutans]MDA0164357.1 LuxR C-terminal-related transcriptional regulator [Solirubrobacter ginsenosidimutans]
MVTRLPGAQLFGRELEREALERLLDQVRSGHSAVLVVHGEPGAGKTALLRYAVEAAPDFRVARTVGVDGEMGFAFAALQRLCAPLLELAERLPPPQRDALAVAFGLRSGTAPNPFLVGLAVLGVLSEAAEEQPLLCLVDDAQWLDRASARSLAFLGRRLLAERIALVFATRELGDATAGLPELSVQPLGRRDARALLESELPAPLDERVLERIVSETRGNPLALLELPRGLTPAQLAGGFGLPAAAPLSASIEESFARRLAKLPHDARRLLLLAAADPVGDPALVWRAAESLGIPDAAAETVEAQGLLAFAPHVVFRHSLVRSAVYGAAGLGERREMHRALADATDPAIDPDRRAWHRAQAAARPDETIATDLERSAARAQARGGFAAAAAFLERAAVLTTDQARRARRQLAAAQAMFRSGALAEALELLTWAEAGGLDEFEQAQAELLRARIAFVSSHGSDAPPLLLGAARRLQPLDPPLAREIYLEAMSAAMFAGRLASPGGSAREVAQAARAAPAPAVARGPDLLLDGLATIFGESYSAAAPALRRAQDAFDVADMPATEQLRWKWLATVSAVHLWDDERWLALSERHVQIAREAGALAELPLALSQRIYVHLFAGELTAAAALVQEIEAATEATGTDLAPYGAVGLLALQGNVAEATHLIDRSRTDVARRGEGIGLSALDWAEAVLYNGLGRYEDARAAALRVTQHPHDLNTSSWGLAELVEASVRAGTPELAAGAQVRLAEIARATGTDWALGIAARSQALLVEGRQAEERYREAVDRLARTRIAVDLARAHLLYGEWLRRERRRTDARAELRRAHDRFSGFGMTAFAERARIELEATGERARRRTADAIDQLTPQEAQISRLAGQGHSNREIAAQLFISPSTVEYHLRKVFRKLDVKSRTQLAHRMS